MNYTGEHFPLWFLGVWGSWGASVDDEFILHARRQGLTLFPTPLSSDPGLWLISRKRSQWHPTGSISARKRPAGRPVGSGECPPCPQTPWFHTSALWPHDRPEELQGRLRNGRREEESAQWMCNNLLINEPWGDLRAGEHVGFFLLQ